MTFASDNWAGASDKVAKALLEAGAGYAPAYGGDPWTKRAREALNAFFDREVTVYFVGTGSAANSVALATLNKPGGVVLCHVDAHIIRDEAGAPLFFSPGTQLDTVDGPNGRIDPGALKARLDDYPHGVVHHGRAAVLSITNVNEIGQTYTPQALSELTAIAKERGLSVHLDGARFANALAFTGASPADLSWRAGADAMSLGFTKAGAWCAEAVVFFDTSVAEDAMYRHKQAAQLFSKNRFAAAQFEAMLDGNHALDLAQHANTMAARLAKILDDAPTAAPLFPPQSNELFAYLAPMAADRLDAAGVITAPWSSRSTHLPAPPLPDWPLRRFVASFRTTDDDLTTVQRLLAG